MSEETGKKRADFLKQGGILAIASLLVRIIGMVYRIPMSNILGEEGNGIYAVAFEIYDVMLIISSYSLPLALSKIISAQQARKQHKNTGKVFKVALKFAIISGGGFAILLFAGAGLIEKYIYPEYSGVQIPLRVLAPTIFIVALLGVFRGFFQGKKTMVPTAFSQIVEQIVNAVVSVAASYLFMKWNIESVQQAAWGAAGGTLGTCLGAASALLIVLFVYWLYKPVQEKLERRDPSTRTNSEKYLFKLLLITIIPIVLSQTVYNISGLIDYKIFGSVSGNLGMDAVTIKSFIGVQRIHLLPDGSEQAGVAGVEPHGGLAGGFHLPQHAEHLLQRHLGAVVDGAARLCQPQQGRVDKAACINDAVGPLQQGRAALGDEVRRAGPGTNKMYHIIAPSVVQDLCAVSGAAVVLAR